MFLKTLICFSLLILCACTVNKKAPYGIHTSSIKPVGIPIKEVAAYGRVIAVNQHEKLIEIKHAPIPELNWAPMLMTFQVTEVNNLSTFQSGDLVNFVLELDKDENYRIKTLSLK